MRVLARWVSPGPLAAKVPEIGLMFWVIKLLTTAAGEATSDYFGDHNVLVGAAAEVLLVAAALILQLRTRRYSATAYWLLTGAAGYAVRRSIAPRRARPSPNWPWRR